MAVRQVVGSVPVVQGRALLPQRLGLRWDPRAVPVLQPTPYARVCPQDPAHVGLQRQTLKAQHVRGTVLWELRQYVQMVKHPHVCTGSIWLRSAGTDPATATCKK